MTKKFKNQAGINWKKWFQSGFMLTAAMIFLCREVKAAQLPVNLGTAGNFVILSKSGISTVPISAITGDIGVSPIAATGITGFSLIRSFGSPFATSAQVTGKVYAANYAAPTPANLTTAIGDMQTAYTDAAGRTTPNFTELGAGQIGGLTLVPGLYKWGTGVLISSDVTLSGGPNDVWIFQIAGKITQANGTKIHLAGGALAKNIFWQVAGLVALGTTSHFEGIIMSKTLISLATGASINGRLLAQTAVTLQRNVVTMPASATTPTLVAGISLSGTSLVFSGTNGISGTTNILLMSTNLATPLSHWTPVATNVLGLSGSFSFTLTNAVNPNIKQQFYILKTQ
jgi:hypothetical protein